MIDQPNRQ